MVQQKEYGTVIRILLADDQQLFSDNLKLMLETLTEDIKVVGIAGDGGMAVDLAEKMMPDLILMDVRMPGMDGVQATRIIHQNHPEIKIVMLTTFLDDTYVEDALQYGAYGYILKNIRSENLIASLRAIFQGSVLFSPVILQKLIPRLDSKPAMDGTDEHEEGDHDNEYHEVISHLGNREKDILKLVAKGYNNKKIADTLFISEPTVRNYISAIYAKVGSKDRLQVISIAQRVYIEKQ
ncbi:MAG: response regulator transcription factor [Treponema sp.]|jgi:DNA-binding NarL/FixJ family response regulator|nr:response regulator transcription factor [Treponema sp.]